MSTKSLTILLICLIISFQGYAQKQRISLKITSPTPLNSVLLQIQQTSGINIIYLPTDLRQHPTITLSASNIMLEQYLAQIIDPNILAFNWSKGVLLLTPAPKHLPVKTPKKRIVTGSILDESDQPLPYATLQIPALQIRTNTDEKGRFTLSLPPHEKLTILASYIGKQSVERELPPQRATDTIQIRMFNSDLKLAVVDVDAVRDLKRSSNSSIIFDREAIENTQAISLADVLNMLPGKSVTETNMAKTNMLTLRSVSGDSWDTDIFSRNNAFSVSYYMDGVQLSNNANMQSLNPAANGFLNPYIAGEYGLGLNNRNTTSGDNAYGGIDMRSIGVDNIESIEVISGVASAKYGDYADGAVIINTQAGKSPYYFRTSFRKGTSQYSVGKGIILPGKLGALNFNGNYLLANNDPRDNLKAYKRLTGSLTHTIQMGTRRQFRNNFSLNISGNLDGAKLDLDDRAQRKSTFEYFNISFTDRLSYQFKEKSWFDQVNLSMGVSAGRQYSSMQYLINDESFPYVDIKSPGIYEAQWANGSYLGITAVEGKPITANANLSLTASKTFWGATHALSMGGNAFLSANKGQGQIIDLERPLFSSSKEQSYNYKNVPTMLNTGIYAEDAFRYRISSMPLHFRIGIRADNQSDAWSFSPRVNTRLELNAHSTLGFAWGYATKAPSLAHRYPGPVYFKIPLINYPSDDPDLRLYLVYADMAYANNNQLKPTRSNTQELSYHYSKNKVNLSVTAYRKISKDGYSTKSIFKDWIIPQYQYKLDANGRPTYSPTGLSTKKTSSYSQIINSLQSENYGIELMANTPKIHWLATSFTVSSAYTNSYYYDSSPYLNYTSLDKIDFSEEAIFAVFPPENRRNEQIRATLSSQTHIPSLALMINLITDFPITTHSTQYGRSGEPIGYYDNKFNFHSIENYDPENPVYGHLATLSASNRRENERHAIKYGNIHLRVTKDINKRLRFSFNVFNMLNWRPSYIVPGTENRVVLNDPPSFGGEISFKL
ncbi:TonB-dependent receptor [Sphingobacterium spiritivorum]|uniref:TonB-dependent receptor n=1 Tax=Sphingobacterium spiritivorum TaxID=258 RepID=UPI003DA5792E